MKINKKILSIGVSCLFFSQFVIAEETQEAERYIIAQNSNSQLQNTPTHKAEIPTVVPNSVPNSDNLVQNPTVVPIDNESGFKGTLMNKVDEKFAKLEELERKISENELRNQLNQSSNMNFNGGGMSSTISVPIALGSTIISNGKKVVSKGVVVADSQGNKFNLNEKNNNIIKSISNEYIVFKDSKDKFPMLITNVNSDNGSSGGMSNVSGFPSSLFEVPNSIKAKAENSQAIGSLHDNSISNTLR